MGGRVRHLLYSPSLPLHYLQRQQQQGNMNATADCHKEQRPEYHVLAWALEAYVALLPLVLLCLTQRRRSARRILRFTLWVVIWLTDGIDNNLLGQLPTTTVHLHNHDGRWIDLKYFWYAHLLMLSCSTANPADSLDGNHAWLTYLPNYILAVANVVYSSLQDVSSWSSRPLGATPLIVLSGLSLLRMWQVIAACRRVEASSGLGRNAKRVADHMEYEHQLATVQEDAAAGDYSQVCDPVDLRGYHYLVMGEEEEPLVAQGRYRWRLQDLTKGSVVTVDRVWRCPGRLLNEGRGGGQPERQRRLKDLCLSFSLYKLLSRRLAGFEFAESDVPKTREFVLSRLLGPSQPPKGDFFAERAFRVVEMELAFLYDSLYTRLPIFFANKWLPTAYALLSLAVAGSYAAAARRVFAAACEVNSMKNTTEKVDFLIQYVLTLVAAAVAIAVEICQLLDYLTSNWGKVVLLCWYVRKPQWQDLERVEQALGFVCGLRRQKPWQRKIGQYSLLRPARCSCLLSPALPLPKTACCDTARTKVVTWEGKARSTARLPLPMEVKEEVLSTLKRIVGDPEGRLTNGKSILEVEGVPRDELRSWAFDFETDSHTHTILVWHVGTTLCDLAAGAASSSRHRTVACCLSKYCAYLAACAPDLLPDASYTNKFLMEAAVCEANKLTKKCHTTEGMYHLLMTGWDCNLTGEDKHYASAGNTIVASGVKLGRILVNEMAEELRWRVLMDFWTEMLLYIAQAEDDDIIQVHAEYLAKGGEFVTHIWALLCHAGVL